MSFRIAVCAACLTASLAVGAWGAQGPPPKQPSVKVVFDTDIGNDVDDVLALSMLHALQTRRDCELLAVTTTIRDDLAGPFVDAINTFYGRPNIPIGCIRPAAAKKESKFLPLVLAKDAGQPRYPHKLRTSADAPDAVALLRRILSQQPDGSVILVQVGFFSNLAGLLDSKPDQSSDLKGPDLIKRKIKLVSIMAGAFKLIDNNKRFGEFNVRGDISASRKVADQWPTPIIWSGFEIGIAVPFPARSIEKDFSYVPHHPAAEAYYLYNPPPHERPTWDLTSVLYAVFPDRGYFGLSAAGRVSFDSEGVTSFTPEQRGRDHFLTLSPGQIERVKEALVQLASQPPCPLR